MNLREILAQGIRRLEVAGVNNPRLDARLLLCHALNISLTKIIGTPETEVSEKDLECYFNTLQKRINHEPVSRIIGVREFWSLPFKISPDTLDPRPDTEILVRSVLEHCADHLYPYEILDFGTGSGCIILALLSELKKAHGVGVDKSSDALKIAAWNARNLGLEERVLFLESDWGRDLDEKFDIIVSNPPYIVRTEIVSLEKEVKDYDPIHALDGGDDGLECYRQLAFDIKRLLKLDGIAALEIGQGQHQDVEAIFSSQGMKCLGWKPDLSGILRCGIFKISE